MRRDRRGPWSSQRLAAAPRASPEVAEQALAALREALSNIARHAEASQADVSVDTDSEGFLTVRVTDNGTGIPSGGRRSGLRNLASRAEKLGGELRLEAADAGATRPGTRLKWRVPRGLPVSKQTPGQNARVIRMKCSVPPAVQVRRPFSLSRVMSSRSVASLAWPTAVTVQPCPLTPSTSSASNATTVCCVAAAEGTHPLAAPHVPVRPDLKTERWIPCTKDAGGPARFPGTEVPASAHGWSAGVLGTALFPRTRAA